MKRITRLQKLAGCGTCGRRVYCQRIPVNEGITMAIEKDGKCPDRVG